MADIILSGSKLYRDLWVTIGKDQHEISGSFGFPKKELNDAQLKIVFALAHGDGVLITEDGKVSAIGEIDLEEYRKEDE